MVVTCGHVYLTWSNCFFEFVQDWVDTFYEANIRALAFYKLSLHPESKLKPFYEKLRQIQIVVELSVPIVSSNTKSNFGCLLHSFQKSLVSLLLLTCRLN